MAAASAQIVYAAKASVAGPKTPMKTYKVPQTDLVVSRIAYGCGGLADWNKDPVNADAIAKASRLINTAYDNGITLFDHADLYAFGKSESVFGEVLKQSPGLREKIVVQSKCAQSFPDGWKPGAPISVELNHDYIVKAVEGSLKRLGTDRLDILLLHAVDALVEPDSVAQAFNELHRAGKVRYFGVSNYNAGQIALLKKSVRQPIVANQIPISLATPDTLVDGMEFTLRLAKGAASGDDYSKTAVGHGTLDYCRVNDIQLQAYSPLRGVLNPKEGGTPELKQTVQLLEDLAKQKNSTPAAVALAWLLRHPAGILPIIGGSKPEYIVENAAADRVTLTREEWYALYAAAGAPLKSS